MNITHEIDPPYISYPIFSARELGKKIKEVLENKGTENLINKNDIIEVLKKYMNNPNRVINNTQSEGLNNINTIPITDKFDTGYLELCEKMKFAVMLLKESRDVLRDEGYEDLAKKIDNFLK